MSLYVLVCFFLVNKIIEISNNWFCGNLDYFEGDIELTPDVIEQLKQFKDAENNGQSSSNITKRNARRDRSRLWVTKIVPYEVPENMKGILV